jgi:hypothetical protein
VHRLSGHAWHLTQRDVDCGLAALFSIIQLYADSRCMHSPGPMQDMASRCLLCLQAKAVGLWRSPSILVQQLAAQVPLQFHDCAMSPSKLLSTCLVVSNNYGTLLEALVPPEYAALQGHELQGMLCSCCDVISPAHAMLPSVTCVHQGMPFEHSFEGCVTLV